MNKILFSPGTEEQLTCKCDALVVGINNLCVNVLSLSIDEVINLINDNKEIYIVLNKNMHNDDLVLLEDTLNVLNKYDIKGIFYADVSLIPICDRLNIKIPLIWSNEHLTTNYHTMNYWYNFNIKYTLISNELTIDEIKDIITNYKGTSIVQVFGYLPMYVSRRHAVKNYLNYFNLSTESKKFSIYKEGKKYPIIDNDIATSILSSNVLCDLDGYNNLLNNGLEYSLISGYGIEKDTIDKVLDIYSNFNSNSIVTYKEEIEKLISNIDTGFWYRKTIYRVKKNDK